MKHISFPSIEKFANIVANINRTYNFVGLDDNNEPIYDLSKPKPTLTFKGTVKLHGTNAGVCYNKKDGLWVQSRENIITPESDNAGFAFFVESNKEAFLDFFKKIARENDLGYAIDVENVTISIYGEWCGGNIQKGVGITNLPKSFFIFGVKVTPSTIENSEKQPVAYWLDSSDLRNHDVKIYNIEDYQTYSVDIDFNVPQLIQNKLIELTLAVEEECPVAKAFGFSGIGEGIVFSYKNDKGEVFRFKSKGEKHAGNSKVNTLRKVDDVKINTCIEISNKVTPTWRLEQMLEKQFDLINGGKIDVKGLGGYIKLVISDIIKEDSDVLAEANLEPKDIGKYVSDIARKYFFSRQNEELGLK